MVLELKIFKEYLNSKGLTLIEILASIVILGIILTTFFSFFSQSMMFSSKVEDKVTATNIAKTILHNVKKNETVINYLNDDLRNNEITYKSGK